MKAPNKVSQIVIAMDSFKGSLTSIQAGNAVAEGMRKVYPKTNIIVLPTSDGGDGMLDTFTQIAKGSKVIYTQVHDPLLRKIEARYGISENGETAYIEMATASGLALLSEEERNPMYTTSYGTGELICDALKKGCRHIILGLGGSATNDAGLGMLQALGFRFFNSKSEELGLHPKTQVTSGMNGCSLAEVDRIDISSAHPALRETLFTIACDVQSPFCGPYGAAFVFAPQKGADISIVEKLDQGLKHLAHIIYKVTGKDIVDMPGAGAAGGMGGSMLAFLNARLVSGSQLILNTLNFKEQIKHTDFIITGEGKSDKQTLMGKIASGILAEALQSNIPVILLSGGIEDLAQLNSAGFFAVFSSTPFPSTLQQAICPQTAYNNLKNTAEQIARLITL